MASSRRQYPFHLIEPKWQQFWDIQQTFRAFNPGEVLPDGHPFAQRHNLSGPVAATQLPPKFYILDMFPYPSGAGLHVGHPEGYTATDILARYKRAQGLHVLHPMGWDAFGLPAEQYAIKTGQHPRQTTEANVANFTKQIKSLGFSYDWSRELATTDPDYFKWTQWIFLKLYNSWFNPETNKAAPIETLKYPKELENVGQASSLSQTSRKNGDRQDACPTFAAFSEIRYPPVASVVLGFRREDVAHSCEGFGMLIPKIEGFKILGTIFSSSLFPNRAPAGHLTLTSYIGGQRYPELALLPAEKLVALTCEDLRVLLGVTGKPVFQHCVLYPKAIPQYNVGYGRYRDLMNEIENRAAGLFFAGHYRDGVSLGDSILSGVNIVERVTNFL
jgi:hypothetical protein